MARQRTASHHGSPHLTDIDL